MFVLLNTRLVDVTRLSKIFIGFLWYLKCTFPNTNNNNNKYLTSKTIMLYKIELKVEHNLLQWSSLTRMVFNGVITPVHELQ